MEANNQQLEVLLLTGTSLTSRQLYKREYSADEAYLTIEEQLEEACWNGFLQTTLPEVNLKSGAGGILYLWQIKKAGAFLELDLGETPASIIDRQYSISPYSFLALQSTN